MLRLSAFSEKPDWSPLLAKLYMLAENADRSLSSDCEITLKLFNCDVTAEVTIDVE